MHPMQTANSRFQNRPICTSVHRCANAGTLDPGIRSWDLKPVDSPAHRIGVLLDEKAAVALARHACRLRRFGRLASAPNQFPGRTPKTAKNDCVGYRVPTKARLLSASWIA